MFSGRYEYTIDDKGRLSIPAKFREILASHNDTAKARTEDDHGPEKGGTGRKPVTPPDLKLVLTNLDGCIVGYPEKEWEELQGRIERLGVPKEAKNFLRFFYSSASECPIDKLGRILIPQSLRNYGAIKEKRRRHRDEQEDRDMGRRCMGRGGQTGDVGYR